MNRIHLNLSRKSIEAQTLRILRSNDNTTGNIIRYKDDKASIRVRPKKAPNARKRLPGEATPPSNDLFIRPLYVPGQGETQLYGQRPGAQDHQQHKSYGLAT